jgi:hypothetical protein
MQIIDKRNPEKNNLLRFKDIKVGETFSFQNCKEINLRTGTNQYFNITKNYTHVTQFISVAEKPVKLVKTELHVLD